MRLLLPYLLAGFGPHITADYRAASLMILTQLGTQATLSDTLVTGKQQDLVLQTDKLSWPCCLVDAHVCSCADCCNADDDTPCWLSELGCSVSSTTVCIP